MTQSLDKSVVSNSSTHKPYNFFKNPEEYNTFLYGSVLEAAQGIAQPFLAAQASQAQQSHAQQVLDNLSTLSYIQTINAGITISNTVNDTTSVIYNGNTIDITSKYQNPPLGYYIPEDKYVHDKIRFQPSLLGLSIMTTSDRSIRLPRTKVLEAQIIS